MEIPDLTTYLILHRGMRFDGARLAAAVQGVSEQDRIRRGNALARWYAGYHRQLHEHHTVEDEIFFPAILERVPLFDSQIDRIEAEHNRLEELLERTGRMLKAISDPNVDWPVASAEAVETTSELRMLLDLHLGFEDADVLPLFVRHFGREEYEDLDERALKSAKLDQLKFAIPWVMEAANSDERDKLFAGAPFAFKLLWYATRRRYNRMARDAFGSAVPAGAVA
ncbi:MAG: hemerythrin domain-containing protein [Actinomycetota bacterium]|nr:hemerythrin domain-containing protein [Actinomycetota bacterium]